MLLSRLLAGLAAIMLITAFSFPTQGQDKKDDPKTEPKKDDPKATEPKKDEAKKDEPKKDEPKKDEPKKDEPKKDEPKKDDKKANLVWKFDVEKKTPYYQTMTMKTEQKFTLMGNVVNQNQEQTFWFSWTPEKKDGDNIVLKQKVEGVKMTIDIGNGKLSYDSTSKNNDPNTLSEFLKALVGSEFTFTLDKNYKVIKIEGYKELIEKLVKANPAMKGLLDAVLNEASLKQMAEPAFTVLPGKEEAENAEWTGDPGALNMGPLGTFSNSYKYKYVGKDATNKALDKIDLTMALKYTIPDAAAQGGALPFKIKSAELNSKDGKGVILYNAEKGYVESSEMSLKLDGSLDVEIGGQATKVTIDQTQSSKIVTSPNKPTELDPNNAKPKG